MTVLQLGIFNCTIIQFCFTGRNIDLWQMIQQCHILRLVRQQCQILRLKHEFIMRSVSKNDSVTIRDI
jgi:hypothetical protein